jgi:hypothetical protein
MFSMLFPPDKYCWYAFSGCVLGQVRGPALVLRATLVANFPLGIESSLLDGLGVAKETLFLALLRWPALFLCH